MVSIPEGGGYYIEIGLVEFTWKVCTFIMNNRVRDAITLYNASHDFRQGRGVVTVIMKAKLVHQLTGIVHEPLFQVFLDV